MNGRGISLCMLVKNVQSGIGRAIESVKHQVNEIVIVDDGSNDNTIGIAQAHGAKIHLLPSPVREIGFGQAVNFMLDKCTCDWILMLDGDEFLERGDLHPLMRYPNNNVWALPRRKWDNYEKGARAELEAYPDYQPKFFKNLPQNRFLGEMHIQWRGDKIHNAWRGPHIEHLQKQYRSPDKEAQRKPLYEKLAQMQGVAVDGGHVLEKK